MEFCAAQGPFDPLLDSHTQRFDVRKDVNRGLVVAALHDAFVGNDREGHTLVHKLFNLRVTLLVDYILDALGPKPAVEDVKPALEAAFQKVDEEVRSKAQEQSFEWPEVHLATRFNSMVVIVYKGWVFTAGDTDARAFLARGSESFYLTSPLHKFHRYIAMGKARVPNHGTEPVLYYFNQERLQDVDEFLVIGSKHIWTYLQQMDFMLPVLQSRIDAEGLEEACKSIVGRFKDRSKILIVITLQPHAHEPKDGRKRRHLDDTAMKELLNTEYVDIDDPDDRVVCDPLRFLLPYVNGKKQHPEPQTSAEYYSFHTIQKPCPEDEIQISSSLPCTS